MTLSAPQRAVKTAWKLLVAKVGGVEAAAACTRASRSLVSDYGNYESPRFAPGNAILDVEEIAGEPLVTAALARARGYELVMVETPLAAGQLASLVAEFSPVIGELFATLAHALTHKNLTPDELADLLREFGDAHRVAGEALHYLKKLEAA
jgi:hypothetical protein